MFTNPCASHVFQTILTLGADVVEKDMTEEKPEDEVSGDQGTLPSMEELILQMVDDIKGSVGALMSERFASHPLRVLLYVLAGKRVDEEGDTKGRFRSKKSKKFKTAHDFNNKLSSRASATRKVPDSFKNALRTLTHQLALNSSETEMRTLAVHNVGNPVIQLLLELQGDDKEGEKVKTALLDRILWGIASGEETEHVQKERKSWFETLVRDKSGSHLMEVILKVAPNKVYSKIYKAHLKGKLPKYSLHPLSNFVVQSLFTNARKGKHVDAMVGEMEGLQAILKSGKFGVIRSMFEASARLDRQQETLVQWLREALGLADEAKSRQYFAPCLMRMQTLTVSETRASTRC